MKSNIKVQWDNIPENRKLAFASFVVELGETQILCLIVCAGIRGLPKDLRSSLLTAEICQPAVVKSDFRVQSYEILDSRNTKCGSMRNGSLDLAKALLLARSFYFISILTIFCVLKMLGQRSIRLHHLL